MSTDVRPPSPDALTDRQRAALRGDTRAYLAALIRELPQVSVSDSSEVSLPPSDSQVAT